MKVEMKVEVSLMPSWVCPTCKSEIRYNKLNEIICGCSGVIYKGKFKNIAVLTRVTEDFIITNHAIQRYRERTGAVYSDEKCKNKIKKLISAGKEVILKPEHRVRELLKRQYKDSKYIKNHNLMIVIEDNIVVTIHDNTANKWMA